MRAFGFALAIALVLAPALARAENIAQIVDANNRFAFDLLQKIPVPEDAKAPNVVVSPLSLAVLMQLALNGAEGKTKDAIANALHLSGVDRAAINADDKVLLDALTKVDQPTGPRLDIATGIWSRGHLKPGFIDIGKDYYNAEVNTLVGNSPDPINQFVAQATHDTIPTILGPKDITAGTESILVNAVYFKARWNKGFNQRKTQDMPFRLVNGSTVPSKMMHSDENGKPYRLIQTSDFSMISLPYLDSNLSMVLALPADNKKLNDTILKISAKPWAEWMKQLNSTSEIVTVALPRLHNEVQIELNRVLESLGMKDAFNANADFSSLSDAKTRISGVVQKTILDVDESGTLAAGVTTMSLSTLSAIRYDSSSLIHLVFDHPFLLAIVDNKSDSLIFLGAINHP